MLGDAGVDGEMRAVLRCADADTRPVAQLIDAIERVDHDEACIEFADERLIEVLYHAEIDLRIERQPIRVRKTAAQTASYESVERECRSAEIVSSTERRGDALVVIQIDPVIVDVGEFRRIEIELR